jgi:nicotinamidase-related amidase
MAEVIINPKFSVLGVKSVTEQGGLKFGVISPRCVHLCVDMQNLFSSGSVRHAPWIERVLPQVERLVAARPDRTIFTRFIPLRNAQEGTGSWQRYYQRWQEMTLDNLPVGSIDLLPSLAKLMPPAQVFDKIVNSPWSKSQLEEKLAEDRVDTMVISATETEVCVLAAVLGAVDRGFRVILPTDALCSSSDEAHDNLLALYRNRYAQQIETATTEEILSAW